MTAGSDIPLHSANTMSICKAMNPRKSPQVILKKEDSNELFREFLKNASFKFTERDNLGGLIDVYGYARNDKLLYLHDGMIRVNFGFARYVIPLEWITQCSIDTPTIEHCFEFNMRRNMTIDPEDDTVAPPINSHTTLIFKVVVKNVWLFIDDYFDSDGTDATARKILEMTNRKN